MPDPGDLDAGKRHPPSGRHEAARQFELLLLGKEACRRFMRAR